MYVCVCVCVHVCVCVCVHVCVCNVYVIVCLCFYSHMMCVLDVCTCTTWSTHHVQCLYLCVSYLAAVHMCKCVLERFLLLGNKSK